MREREYTRRTALRVIGIGAVGTVAANTGAAATARVPEGGQRDDERVQFVEADPEAGFNFPYWLATPETFRSEPVPLLVTMNSAHPGQQLTGGGPDKPITVAERARSEVKSFGNIGAWASEQLGIPHLAPVFPMANTTQRIKSLGRQTLLMEDDDLERVDRQLLRMTEHARQQVLAKRQMHDQLLFWGHSSAGTAAEHMAVLHPEEIMAFAASGINGAVTLPLTELGDHTLKYEVGVADLDAITGTPFDPAAFDEVDKFYIQGTHDTSNRLKFQVPGELPGAWSEPEIYETAKAVYGRLMVEDRLPRCHIAFEKAGISGQFRIYPEMTHDAESLMELGGSDVLEFLRRSIEGKDVSPFGQRLSLPFDRTVELNTSDPSVGDQLRLAVSGEYPPPEGLVTYNWQVDNGRSASGSEATFTFEDSGNYEVSLAMETAHGQFAQRGMSLMTGGSSFAAYRYDVTPPRTDLLVGQSILIETDVTNVGSRRGDRRLELHIDGEKVDSRGAALEPGVSKRIPFSHYFDEPGEFEVSVPPAYTQTVSVQSEQTVSETPSNSPTATDQPSTPTGSPFSTSSPTEVQETPGTSAQTPGFGVLAALAGIGSMLSYFLYNYDSGDR